jgi:hypothetical protein
MEPKPRLELPEIKGFWDLHAHQVGFVGLGILAILVVLWAIFQPFGH